MKILVHRNGKLPLKVISSDGSSVILKATTCPAALQELAVNFPKELIGWCEEKFLQLINFEKWDDIFHHQLIMASYSVSNDFPLLSGIGYVENSPFLKINFKRKYPSWLMSTDVGAIHGKTLRLIDKKFFQIRDFSYFLLCVAKLGQNNHLFCYSEPALLKEPEQSINEPNEKSRDFLFRFVKQNYKLQWSFVLLFSYLIFERKFPVLPFLKSLRYGSHLDFKFDLGALEIKSGKEIPVPRDLDVVIPTLGRKDCVYNILCDLRDQTFLPASVIIVEQNPDPCSASELNFLFSEAWPFKIIHHFTNQLGACHARNWALEKVTSEWVFLSDDDIRLKNNFLEEAFEKIIQYSSPCSTFSFVPEFGQGIKNEKVNQSTVFGSGNSFIKSDLLEGVRFSKELEYGYGEDIDFGMQLRNKGVDVVHFPTPQIKHLKAPIGGFRTETKMSWQKSAALIKPSPTVLWVKLKHLTREQFLGYKLFYFLFQMKNGRFNLLELNRQWRRSREYVNKL